MKKKKGGAVGLAVIVTGLSAVTAFVLVVGKLFRRKKTNKALDEFEVELTEETTAQTEE